MEYTIVMNRTYSTSFTIDAESSEEAIKKFNELGDSKYSAELEQCNVTAEHTEIHIY